MARQDIRQALALDGHSRREQAVLTDRLIAERRQALARAASALGCSPTADSQQTQDGTLDAQRIGQQNAQLDRSLGSKDSKESADGR